MEDHAQQHGERGDLRDAADTREIRLLDHGQDEHDRRQAARTEPPDERHRRRGGTRPYERQRHGQHPDHRQAGDGVRDRLDVDAGHGRTDDLAPEQEERDRAEHSADLLHQPGRLVGELGSDCPAVDDPGDEGRDEAAAPELVGDDVRDRRCGERHDLRPLLVQPGSSS